MPSGKRADAHAAQTAQEPAVDHECHGRLRTRIGGLGWFGLGWFEVVWVGVRGGLGWVGLGWVGLVWVGVWVGVAWLICRDHGEHGRKADEHMSRFSIFSLLQNRKLHLGVLNLQTLL